MNKDFFTKPISLKDIKLSNIDFKKLKNKKEILIGILILIYVIVICLVGSNLLNKRKEVKEEFKVKESRYTSLLKAPSEEKLKEQILELDSKQSELEAVLSEVTPGEFNEIFSEFKKGAFINWETNNEDIRLTEDLKKYPEYDIYVVNISSFSGTFQDVEAFLEYVSNYNRIVRIDSISFRENQLTGKMGGQVKMSFYFKKLSE